MTDDDRASGEPDGSRERSLELPSLRTAFRRRRVGAKVRRDPAESSPDESARKSAPAVTRERRSWRLRLPGPLAALVTGAVVGLAMVALTSAGLHACTSWRGTSSCGTPGILLLLVIAAVAVVLGSIVLRLAGVPTHSSTSLLGVGLLVVVILLAMLPVLDDPWVVVAVPALAMLTHLVAWWLTTTQTAAGSPEH